MIILMVLGFFLVLSGLITEEHLSVRQAEVMVHKFYLKQQAYHEAASALKFLIFYLKSDDFSYDTLNDRWATSLEFPLPEGEMTVRVEDEERYLNLNLVRTEAGFRIIKRLFEELSISSLSPELLRVWVGGPGFWDRAYPPKKAPFDSLEELLFLGMSREDFYGKTRGFVFYPGLSTLTTVWSNGRVNLNTAPPEVIMALSPRIDRTLAERLLEYRRIRPLKKIDDVILIEGYNFEILHDLRPWATVRSENFRVTIEVTVGEVEGELRAIVKRIGPALKVVYWRFS